MTIINPYLETMNNNSDDELFEIILNQDRVDGPLLYDAAVITAMSRELITDYQAKGLLNGDKSVLDYNPENLEKQPDDYKIEKTKNDRFFNYEENKIMYGLALIGFGILLVYLTHINFLHFRYSRFFGSIIIVIGGLILTILGFVEKRNSK